MRPLPSIFSGLGFESDPRLHKSKLLFWRPVAVLLAADGPLYESSFLLRIPESATPQDQVVLKRKEVLIFLVLCLGSVH